MKHPLTTSLAFFVFCCALNVIARTVKIAVEILRTGKQLEHADAQAAFLAERKRDGLANEL